MPPQPPVKTPECGPQKEAAHACPEPSYDAAFPSLATSILALQRTAGNRAVGHLLRAAVDSPPPQMPAIPTIVHDVVRAPGQPLDLAIRTVMGQRFGHDFSRVRVHTDARAAAAARAVQARAYTLGQDIVFGAGQYALGTAAGQQLLTHELVHVVQQNQSVSTSALQIESPQSAGEQEAQHLASAASGPHGFSPRYQATTPVLQRQESDPSRRGGATATGGSPATQTGFLAWFDFIREKTRVLGNPVGMSSTRIAIEEQTLLRMNELLRRDPRAADREIPLLAYSRIQREVVAEMSRQPASARPPERVVPASPEAMRLHSTKFNEFLALARRLWGYSAENFPYSIPIPSEGRDILVTGDPARQAVLNDVANALMRWATDHMFDANYPSVSPHRVLADLLQQGGYAQRLAQAATQPLASESIDRREIVARRALGAFGETVATGLLVIGLIGAAVGAGIITGGAALVILGGLAAYAGVTSYLQRREEIENASYDVPIPMTMLHSVGDIAGLSQLIEGITGERLGTGQQLTSVQRSEQLGTGAGSVALLLTGSRAYRAGQGVGQQARLSRPGLTPRGGPEGSIREPAPTDVIPVRPEPHPAAGATERATRATLPENVRLGFDDWMAEIRRNGGDPETVLNRMPADRRPEIAQRQAERRTQEYNTAVQRAQRAQRARDVAGSDPLRPQLRQRDQVGDVVLRYETRRPSPTDIQFAQEIHNRTGEPVELFGNTPRGFDYPGIDGVIGRTPRPLSLKTGAQAAHPNYARWAAEEALISARNASYTHVEVHIRMPGSTVAEIRAAWNAPAPQPNQVVGRPTFDSQGTVAKIVIYARDNVWTLTPPLQGPALPGVRLETGQREERRP